MWKGMAGGERGGGGAGGSSSVVNTSIRSSYDGELNGGPNLLRLRSQSRDTPCLIIGCPPMSAVIL